MCSLKGFTGSAWSVQVATSAATRDGSKTPSILLAEEKAAAPQALTAEPEKKWARQELQFLEQAACKKL